MEAVATPLEFSSVKTRKGDAEEARRGCGAAARGIRDLRGEGRRMRATSRGGSYAGRAVATPGVR